MSDMRHAVFELDDDKVATGAVHPFCDEACRDAWLKDLGADGSTFIDDTAGRNVIYYAVAMSDICDGCECEQCGTTL